MPKITLENGIEVELSQESYNNLVKAVQPKSYDDIAKLLFLHKQTYFLRNDGAVASTDKLLTLWHLSNNCTTRKQAEKLLAINKLMNVAKYLNNGWQAALNGSTTVWAVCISETNKIMQAQYMYHYPALVYFKTADLAKQAVEILGEKTIKLALSTDY